MTATAPSPLPRVAAVTFVFVFVTVLLSLPVAPFLLAKLLLPGVLVLARRVTRTR